MELIITLSLIILVFILTYILARRQQSMETSERQMALRPFSAHIALKGQVSRAVESASRLHISLGRASLISASSPMSLAAASILDRLAEDGCANDTPPITTVGDGTLLPLAENRLRYAATLAGNGSIPTGTAQFIAAPHDAYAYAGGVTSVIQQEKILGNVLVGQFGAEIGIVTEVAGQHDVNQIIGSDDPQALAIAMTATEDVMIGEELLAAPAYFEGSPFQIASLQVQDLLRLVISVTILGAIIYNWVLG